MSHAKIKVWCSCAYFTIPSFHKAKFRNDHISFLWIDALNKYGANVAFMTIWGMGHQEAELVGTPAGNFITWVHECFQ